MMMTILRIVVALSGFAAIIWLLVLAERALERRRERIAIRRWKQHHDYDSEHRRDP